jgi:hypothetical protein
VITLPAGDGDREDVAAGGTIVVDAGCTYVDGPAGARSVVLWPSGSRWDAANAVVATGGGDAVRSGDHVTAYGSGVTVVEALSLLGAEGDEALHRCAEADAVTLLRHEVRRTDPPSWTPPTTTAAPQG